MPDRHTTNVRSEDGFRRYFSMIPNMVVDDDRLTRNDRALYLYYARVCGQDSRCFRSRDRIARETGMAWRTVLTSRKRLAGLGYITIMESDRSPIEVRMVDVWDENARTYLKGGNETTPGVQMNPGGVQESPPGVQDVPPKKKESLRSGSDPEMSSGFCGGNPHTPQREIGTRGETGA